MHYTRIVEGIAFVYQVTTRHYKSISIHTVGKLFGFYYPKGFCLRLLVFSR